MIAIVLSQHLPESSPIALVNDESAKTGLDTDKKKQHSISCKLTFHNICEHNESTLRKDNTQVSLY